MLFFPTWLLPVSKSIFFSNRLRQQGPPAAHNRRGGKSLILRSSFHSVTSITFLLLRGFRGACDTLAALSTRSVCCLRCVTWHSHSGRPAALSSAVLSVKTESFRQSRVALLARVPRVRIRRSIAHTAATCDRLCFLLHGVPFKARPPPPLLERKLSAINIKRVGGVIRFLLVQNKSRPKPTCPGFLRLNLSPTNFLNF